MHHPPGADSPLVPDRRGRRQSDDGGGPGKRRFLCRHDAALGLQASSWLYGDTTVVLPENGWIVFSGEEGAQFHIYLSQP